MSKLQILTTSALDIRLKETAASHGVVIDEVSLIETATVHDASLANELKQLVHKDILAVMTSVKAAEATAELLQTLQPRWRIACTEPATLLKVKALFPACSIVAIGINAKELAERILADCDDRDLYFFCGNMRRPDLPEILKSGGRQVHEKLVYSTRETPVRVEKNYSGLLFFSPSAVRSYFSCNQLDPSTVLFAMGGTTAAELQGLTNNKIVVANSAGKEQLVNEVLTYFARNGAEQI